MKKIALCLARSVGFLLFLSATGLASAGEAEGPPPADLSLEELLRADVQTASRKAQRLQDVAAAAFVITREDIERSGATSLPEALRLAPGVQVARLANNRWAVTARGFTGRFANKLLVLMDGRSIYSPLFSGVLWEMEDTLLEDIDRIEVIRGPGAALWGSNAVNGVINIITRKARDTVGVLAVAGAGTEERGFEALRYGQVAGDGHFRVWEKAFSRDRSVNLAGEPGNDAARERQAGFRGDWTLGGGRLTLSGSVLAGTSGDRWILPSLTSPQGFAFPSIVQKVQNQHLLARYEWLQSDGAEAALQGYVAGDEVELVGTFHERRQTVDLEFQSRPRLGGPHDIVWGVGYRESRDRMTSGGVIEVTPDRRSFRLASAFLQDEITLEPDLWRLVLGARLEYNNFTRFELQPNARLIWTPTPQQTLWAAISRAVRTPSRAEQDAAVDLAVTPAVPPVPAVLLRNVPPPDHRLDSERVNAIELGYRHQVGARLSFDLALFHNRYDRVRAAELSARTFVFEPVPHVVQTIVPDNAVDARTRGAEVAVDWRISRSWRLQPAYSYIRAQAEAKNADPTTANSAARIERTVPRHQFSLRSSHNLTERTQLDLWLRHASGLPAGDAATPSIPAYTTLDVRFAWRPLPALELSIVGQNLLDRRHPEFVPDLLPSEVLQVERSVYVKAKWQF